MNLLFLTSLLTFTSYCKVIFRSNTNVGKLFTDQEPTSCSLPKTIEGAPSDADDNPMRLKRVLSSAATLSGEITPDVIKNAENIKRIQAVFSKDSFDKVFPMANGDASGGNYKPYTYDNFLKAAAKWPKFCNDVGPDTQFKNDPDKLCKLELASMFAHFAQEVGKHEGPVQDQWKQGLYYFSELGCANTSGCQYRGGTCEPSTWQGKKWPCPKNARYYGRGAKQLSYNYNYGPFSEAMFGDLRLLENPDLVLTDGWLAFASAFWFYMTPQSPKPSMHDVVTGYWIPNDADKAANRLTGFGVLIMIINGGIECGSVKPQAENRVVYFKSFCDFFDIPSGSNLKCDKMQQFDSGSSGALNAYWEQSWSGKRECKLVSYQTSYSIFDDMTNLKGPYCKCVDEKFNGKAADETTKDSSAASTTTTTDESKPSPKTPEGFKSPCLKEDCKSCLSVAGNNQSVTDSQCTQCTNSKTQWWPCNVVNLCKCSEESGGSKSTDTNDSAAPKDEPKKEGPDATQKEDESHSEGDKAPCNQDCQCVAVRDHPQGVNDDRCKYLNKENWWPFETADLCQCQKKS